MRQYEIEIDQERKDIEYRKQMLNQYAVHYRKQIDKYLFREQYDEVTALFDRREVLELAQMDSEFAVLNIVINIYRMEQNDHVFPAVWNGMHSIEQIVHRFIKIKMFMWRLEFTEDRNCFIDYVVQNQISLPFMKWLIHTSAFHKSNTAFQIAQQLKDRKLFVQAFGMLNYLNELSDEKELIFCEMADICMQLQQYEAAASCIEKIGNGTELLNKYKRKWGLLDEEQ